MDTQTDLLPLESHAEAKADRAPELGVASGSTCCVRPSVVTMDYTADGVRKTNRCCTKCYTHWFGAPGEVREYTRKEWDGLMETAIRKPVDWDQVRETMDPLVVLQAMLAIWDPCDDARLSGWGPGEIDLIEAARRVLGLPNRPEVSRED
jgi:hypothetical protein